MDQRTHAARDFYKLVLDHAEQARPWDTTATYHDVTPDEQWDPTLVSERVYGRREEFLAVMAAAGMNTFDEPVPMRRLVLPTAETLRAFKRRAGFESIADYREDGKPVWED
jgi:hypothetical protein